MTSELGWEGTKVRHADGRSGVIQREYIGFMHAHLTIRCDDGTKAFVQLNTNGPDTGEGGWEWFCDRIGDGGRWITLGYHGDDQ